MFLYICGVIRKTSKCGGFFVYLFLLFVTPHLSRCDPSLQQGLLSLGVAECAQGTKTDFGLGKE